MRPGGKSFHEIRITRTASTIDSLLGAPVRARAAEPVGEVLRGAREAFGDAPCDRVFMYNPDAVAAWIYEKYREDFRELERRAPLKLSMLSVTPPVTPVCFGSMYSGLMPREHGIMKYEKPVLRVPTLFDDLTAAGKRPAIICTEGDSIARIFLERDMDYFIYPTKQACNRKAEELIAEDRHDLIVLYNGDYDHFMHRHTPEGRRAVRALRENIETFCGLRDFAAGRWSGHNAVFAFAPDHGCHRQWLFLGNHGVEEPCDMNICHFYGFLPREGRGPDEERSHG